MLLAGQLRVDRLPVSMSEDAVPVGVRVAHCDLRLEKSGDTGVGVLEESSQSAWILCERHVYKTNPFLVNPPSMLVPVTVALTSGPYEIRP